MLLVGVWSGTLEIAVGTTTTTTTPSPPLSLFARGWQLADEYHDITGSSWHDLVPYAKRGAVALLARFTGADTPAASVLYGLSDLSASLLDNEPPVTTSTLSSDKPGGKAMNPFRSRFR